MKKQVNIAIFLDGEGRLKQLPAPMRTKIPVLAYLASKFEAGRFYNEKEVNQIVEAWHSFHDYFILRRLLIDYRFLARTADGTKYWVLESEQEKGDSCGQEKGTEAQI